VCRSPSRFEKIQRWPISRKPAKRQLLIFAWGDEIVASETWPTYLVEGGAEVEGTDGRIEFGDALRRERGGACTAHPSSVRSLRLSD
jgi:hypothetical protein